ncbi:phage related lysozyme [Bartonella australis AUST/NH1]|uniref:Lysozyme n=1 Tax=Bartonella australis (strain Aust/NH1) TaxID=1094489 RepID=M1PEA6_BARAA|nr:glycoside hydrolase family protein [Bartonella australis]AGF74951.1 phage related lysozyme [Bartonella australis AUST/NH1]
MRKISKEGLELIKQWEGLRLQAYQDTAGVWTIGYGHTVKAGEPFVQDGMKITQSQADTILRRDLKQFEKVVEQEVSCPLTDGQFTALVSFCYNIGTEAFRNSTLLKKLNKGHYEAVPAELQKWTKAGGQRLQGLVHRRSAESGLWTKGAYVASNYQGVEAPKSDSLLNVEILAPLMGSFSGLTGIFTGYGPAQWALATVMVLAAIMGIWMYIRRTRE